MDRLKAAYLERKPYSIRVKAADMEQWNTDELSKRQLNRFKRAHGAGKGVDISLNPKQIEQIVNKEAIADIKPDAVKQKLGQKIFDSPVSHSIPKVVFDSVRRELKHAGQPVPKYDENMRLFVLTLLSVSPDFISLVESNPSEAEIRKVIRVLKRDQVGEGFFDTVKDLSVKGMKGLWKGVKAVARGTVNVIRNTGINLGQKLKQRFATKDGIMSTLGEVASAAYTGFKVGELEGAAIGALTALGTALGKDILSSFTSAVGKEIDELFAKPKTEAEPEAEPVAEPVAESVAEPEAEPAEPISIDETYPVVGTGSMAPHYAINQIMSRIIHMKK